MTIFLICVDHAWINSINGSFVHIWFYFQIGSVFECGVDFTPSVQCRLIYFSIFITCAISTISNGVVIANNKKPPRSLYELSGRWNPNQRAAWWILMNTNNRFNREIINWLIISAILGLRSWLNAGSTNGRNKTAEGNFPLHQLRLMAEKFWIIAEFSHWNAYWTHWLPFNKSSWISSYNWNVVLNRQFYLSSWSETTIWNSIQQLKRSNVCWNDWYQSETLWSNWTNWIEILCF